MDNPLEQIPNLEEEDNTAKNEGSDLHSKGHLKKSIPTQRKTLIPNNCIIRISNPKANKIYDELKKIDVRSFVNCAAVTLRVFLELSVDTFIEKKDYLKKEKFRLPILQEVCIRRLMMLVNTYIKRKLQMKQY